jgi:hypothetical protein
MALFKSYRGFSRSLMCGGLRILGGLRLAVVPCDDRSDTIAVEWALLPVGIGVSHEETGAGMPILQQRFS